MSSCPLCETHVQQTPGAPYEVVCDNCGRFTLDQSLLDELDTICPAHMRPYLSIAIQQRQRHIDGPFQVTPEKIPELIQSGQNIPLSAKARAILEDVADQSVRYNYEARIWPARRARYNCVDHDDVTGTVDYLSHLQLITVKSSSSAGCIVSLTPLGWKETEAQGSKQGIGFIAMSFAGDLDEASVAIHQAIEQAGFDPDRVDKQHFGDKICDRVMAGIRRAQFVVVDVTDHRPNVYYEAGFAAALGKPIFWTRRKGETTHFDVRQYQYLDWETPEELRRKLADALRARLPNSKPSDAI